MFLNLLCKKGVDYGFVVNCLYIFFLVEGLGMVVVGLGLIYN